MYRKPERRVGNSKRWQQSPKYDKYARPRKADANVDELIKFVRENQTIRQPTNLTLQRRAPLPGIGQSIQPIDVPINSFLNISVKSSVDSDVDDGLGDSYPDVDDDLDVEIASCAQDIADVDDILRDFTSQNTFNSSKNYNLRNKDKTHRKTRKNSLGNISQTGLIPTKKDSAMNVPRYRKLPPLLLKDLPLRPSGPAPCITPDDLDDSEEYLLDDDDDELLDCLSSS